MLYRPTGTSKNTVEGRLTLPSAWLTLGVSRSVYGCDVLGFLRRGLKCKDGLHPDP
jgi:hypothetical protein